MRACARTRSRQTTKRGIPKYMAGPNRRKMTVEKEHKIVDNLNSATPIQTELAKDVESNKDRFRF